MSKRLSATGERKNEALLKEIRDRFSYASDQWQDIRDEGARDMRCVAGDVWKPEDRKAREDAGRPCLSLDELSQYVNQLINDVRQNQRAIKVTAEGDGADDETARLRADLIRQIEYRSNAQQAYTTMFENAVQRSFGYLRVKAQYVSDRSFDQELLIEPIVNPDDVTPDPDSVKTDGSDLRYLFIRESRSHDEFKREYPTAEIHNFDADMITEAGKHWLTDSKVFLAEYWCKKVRKRELLALRVTLPGSSRVDTQLVFEDELEKGVKPSPESILRRRTVDEVSVVSYLTNGLEILSETPWPGKSIPIVPCYGKVLYVDEGAGSKRRILSLVRLARDPAMLYCFYRTNEAEVVGMTPKTPFVGYTGQFRGHEDKWQTVNAKPLAYLEANAKTEATGQDVLPLPQRQPYEPPIAALEIGAEAARRAIQAAMGISPMPTSAQRRNEKSGVALRQIEDSQQKGSFHFIDHYDESIKRTGAIIDELIPHYYDTAREVTVRGADDETRRVAINDPAQPDSATGKPLEATKGRHDVTISVGPSYDSEREAASDFADLLVQNPQVFPLVAPLVVKLKNLGPIGDKLADLLKLLMPAEARAVLDAHDKGELDPVQLQLQLAEAMKQNEVLTGELEAKTRAIETDAVKAQAQVAIEELKQTEAGARAIAEIELKAQIEMAKLDLQREQLDLDRRKLEVQLEIEMAKLGSAQAMARAEIEQQDLHHHDAQQLAREQQQTEVAQADLDRQAEADAAERESQERSAEGAEA